MHNLTCLLIPQGIFLQSPVIIDTGLLQKFPSSARILGSETNILRDLCANS